VSLFPFFKKQNIADSFSKEDKEKIVDAIKIAERSTSGEVRVFIESKCSYINAIDRAEELFGKLEMYKTEQRNAVLVYIAFQDKQLAVYGDKGIHEKVGTSFWNEKITEMIQHFSKANYADGIATIVKEIGEALVYHFPYLKDSDINELPDDIVFGK